MCFVYTHVLKQGRSSYLNGARVRESKSFLPLQRLCSLSVAAFTVREGDERRLNIVSVRFLHRERVAFTVVPACWVEIQLRLENFSVGLKIRDLSCVQVSKVEVIES